MSVTLLERDELGARGLARGRGHARAGGRGRVRRGRRGACSSSGCARPRCGRPSPPSWRARAAIEVGLRERARCWSPATTTRRASSSASSSFATRWPARRAAASRARRASASRRWRPTLRLALEAPEDHSVDPAAGARRAAARVRGAAACVLREHAPVARSSATPRARASRACRRAPAASVCGRRRWCSRPAPGASEIGGLPAGARVPVRPVKGQILRLRDPAGPGLLTRVVRFEGGYLLPRGDGRYVLGATVEERGFELHPDRRGRVRAAARRPRAGARRDASSRSRRSRVGLRPGTPDNAPLIGRGALEGLIWATGHHRNGILLAPADRRAGARAARRRRPRRGPRRAARGPATPGASPRRCRASAPARAERRRRRRERAA